MTDFEHNNINVTEIRISMGMTQSAFASLLDIPCSELEKWECGIADPDIDVLQRVCQIQSIDCK